MQERNVLIVDDRIENRQAAAKAFEGLGYTVVPVNDCDNVNSGLTAFLAKDYRQGMRGVDLGPTDAYIDLFFPEEEGSGKREMGQEVITDLESFFEGEDHYDMNHAREEIIKAERLENELQNYIKEKLQEKVSGEDMNRWMTAATLAAYSQAQTVPNLILTRPQMFKRDVDMFQRCNMKPRYWDIMEDRVEHGKEDIEKLKASAYPFQYMREGLKEDEARQPLGIKLGNKADERGIDVTIATSENHHHAGPREAEYYAGRKNWHFGERQDKTDPKKWEKIQKEHEEYFGDSN